MNRLARAENGQGAETLYRYNGLGQRTGRTENSREEHYLLNLTRPYHNLLGITGEGKEQTFYGMAMQQQWRKCPVEAAVKRRPAAVFSHPFSIITCRMNWEAACA